MSTRSPAVPFQGYCWLVWLLGTVVLIYKFASQTGYSAVNEAVGVSFTLSLQDLAWLGSLYTYSFAVCTLLGGPLLDYYGARVTLSLALLANAIGALSFAAASTPTGLQIGQVLMGMGGAFGFPGVGYLIRHWFPLRAFGLLFGLTQTVVCIVTAALQSVLGFALASMPWQTLIRCWGYVGMFVALVIVLMIRESPDLRRDAIGPPGGGARAIVSALREVAAIREFWIATLLCAVSFSVLLALAVLWGARLLAAQGFGPATANGASACIWYGLAAGAPLVAVVARKLKSFKSAYVVFLLGLLASVSALLFVPLGSAFAAYAVCIAIGFFGSAEMLSLSIVAEVCREARAGTAVGLLNAVTFISSGLLIAAPSWFLPPANPDVAALVRGMLFFPATIVVALGATALLRHRLETSSG